MSAIIRMLAFGAVTLGGFLSLLMFSGASWIIFASWACALVGLGLALFVGELRWGGAAGIAAVLAAVAAVLWTLSLRIEGGNVVGGTGVSGSLVKASEVLALLAAPIGGGVLVAVAGPWRARKLLLAAVGMTALMLAWGFSGLAGAALEGAVVLGLVAALVLHALALRASFTSRGRPTASSS